MDAGRNLDKLVELANWPVNFLTHSWLVDRRDPWLMCHDIHWCLRSWAMPEQSLLAILSILALTDVNTVNSIFLWFPCRCYDAVANGFRCQYQNPSDVLHQRKKFQCCFWLHLTCARMHTYIYLYAHLLLTCRLPHIHCGIKDTAVHAGIQNEPVNPPRPLGCLMQECPLWRNTHTYTHIYPNTHSLFNVCFWMSLNISYAPRHRRQICSQLIWFVNGVYLSVFQSWDARRNVD